MNEQTLGVAVVTLRRHFQQTDKNPLQLTSIDLYHFATSLRDLFVDTVNSVENHIATEMFVLAEKAYAFSEAVVDKRTLLSLCEGLLGTPAIKISKHLQMLAACFYIHFTSAGSKP